MSKLFGKIAGFFTNRILVGMDKAGNRYFFVKEELDGILKEKRWVVFKGEDDPTSIPVEWICWLNGQRKKAPTPEEMMELEARREHVRQNVAVLKKEEMERNSKEGNLRKVISPGQVTGPDLKSFIRQFPTGSKGAQDEEGLATRDSLRWVLRARGIWPNIQTRNVAATNMNVDALQLQENFPTLKLAVQDLCSNNLF